MFNKLKKHPNLEVINQDVRNLEDINLNGIDSIIHLANIIPYKNHKLVLKSLYKIKNRNFKILFVGGISNLNYYKELL